MFFICVLLQRETNITSQIQYRIDLRMCFRNVQKHSVLSRHLRWGCLEDSTGVGYFRVWEGLASILLCAFASTSKQILRKHFHYSNLSSSSWLLGGCLARWLIWLCRPPFITFTAGSEKRKIAGGSRHAAIGREGNGCVYPGNEP